MSEPIKVNNTELGYVERALREAYPRLQAVMPVPDSPGWEIYVLQQYVAFRESGQ